MERFIYWIKRCMYGRNRYCSRFCPACKYYEYCKQDDIEEES